MSSRADKAQKNQKDKHHAILRELVQELPNKTCAECLAKGPRWSSWSLGVFVCIRCAGIHRNLGVHISKMKSIDLDSWTPEQLQNVLRWGNKRAAEYFECYLPKDFVRPQTNHALESFIRNKYEKKLYIKKDGEPPENPESKINRLKNNGKEEKVEKEKKSSSSTSRQRRVEKKPAEESKPSKTILNIAKNDTNSLSPVQRTAASEHHKSHSMNDLLSLDHPNPVHNDIKHSASSNDLLNFGAWSDPVPHSTSNDPFASNTLEPVSNSDLFANTPTPQPSNNIFNETNSQTNTQVTATSSAPTKSTKESILSLYGSGGGGGMQQQQQQMFNVPGGMYTSNHRIPQQQQMPSYQGYQQPAMMNQMNQMNAQMQQMNFGQQPGILNRPQQQPQQQQQQFNMYNQQQMMYNTPQRPMMQNYQMPSQQQQQNFGMMGQQPQNMGWSQQNMMGQPQQMTNGMSGNFDMNSGMGKSASGNTMNNLLWN